MITLETKNQKQLIKTICQTMATIALTNSDTVWNLFAVTTDSAICEDLAAQLDLLGVHEPHIEWFFELNLTKDEYQNWITLCVENPGPEA